MQGLFLGKEKLFILEMCPHYRGVQKRTCKFTEVVSNVISSRVRSTVLIIHHRHLP